MSRVVFVRTRANMDESVRGNNRNEIQGSANMELFYFMATINRNKIISCKRSTALLYYILNNTR